MADELTPEISENPENPDESEEPIKQRKNGLYPGVSDELAENMKSGWADTELRDLEPIPRPPRPPPAVPPCPPASPANAW
ncbi:hypothetical protein SVIOM342S_05828 [Streptomyces violaceorubidus]